MTMEKLEPKYIISYLPYKLTALEKNIEGLKPIEVIGIMTESGYSNQPLIVGKIAGMEYYISQIKPILKPLTDYLDITGKPMNKLNIDIGDQIVLSEYAGKRIGLSGLYYDVAEIMFKNHIDIFRLIPEGLAVDINTL